MFFAHLFPPLFWRHFPPPFFFQLQELRAHEWVKASVAKGEYTYFKFKHNCTKGRMNIQLKPLQGDPDLYAGNHQVIYIYKFLILFLCVCVKFRCMCMEGRMNMQIKHSQEDSDLYAGTEWQTLIGCLKLRVIFRKRATNYRALLRKTTYTDKVSYGSSAPCDDQVIYIYIHIYVCVCGWVGVRNMTSLLCVEFLFHKHTCL